MKCSREQQLSSGSGAEVVLVGTVVGWRAAGGPPYRSGDAAYRSEGRKAVIDSGVLCVVFSII